MKSINDLKKKWKLEKWDIIYFWELKHKVWEDHFENLSSKSWFDIYNNFWVDPHKIFMKYLWYDFQSDFWDSPHVWKPIWKWIINTSDNQKDLYKLAIAIFENIVDKKLKRVYTS